MWHESGVVPVSAPLGSSFVNRALVGRLTMSLLTVLLVACAQPGDLSPSPAGGTSRATAGQGFLPAGCHPLVFRDPAGDVISLTGRWVSGLPDSPPEAPPWGQWSGTWIRQAGDCIWGVDFSDPTEPRFEPDVWSWTATLGGSLELVVTTIFLTQDDPTDIAHAAYGRVGFDQTGDPLICWSATANTMGGCPQGLGPDDVIFYRLAETPGP